jgi:hypothetical protein
MPTINASTPSAGRKPPSTTESITGRSQANSLMPSPSALRRLRLRVLMIMRVP